MEHRGTRKKPVLRGFSRFFYARSAKNTAKTASELMFFEVPEFGTISAVFGQFLRTFLELPFFDALWRELCIYKIEMRIRE